MKKYQILRLSLLRPHKWVRHGHFYLICGRKQNKHMKITKITKRIKHLAPINEFGIPVTAFSHATTACAQYKWRTMVKDREILTRVQLPHVSILINLKGRYCYQRGIESVTAHVKRVSVTQKKHTLRTQGAREANDNSNEWVSFFTSQ